MKPIEIIILAVVILIFIVTILTAIIRKKKGKTSCGCDCSSCYGGCSGCKAKNKIQNVKKIENSEENKEIIK